MENNEQSEIDMSRLNRLSMEHADDCLCGSGLLREPQYDAQSIFLFYSCSHCDAEKRSKYRPEILSGYDQSDVDEPIEPDDYEPLEPNNGEWW